MKGKPRELGYEFPGPITGHSMPQNSNRSNTIRSQNKNSAYLAMN